MSLRPDLAAIADMIRPGARVLDVGCGDGALLAHLKVEKGVDGRGIELIQSNVNACVARGLAVVQGDADSDLVDYPAQVFDAVVPIACAARHSAQNIAFHEVGRQAIMADPDWKGGEYQLHGTKPSKGLAVARMAAHITYVSEMT